MWPYLQRPATAHVEDVVCRMVCDTYLIITSDELTNCVMQPFTHDHLQSPLKFYDYAIKVPLLPCLCLLLPQDMPRNCPVVLNNFSFLTPALVDLIVLTYVLATRRVASHVEHFSLAQFLKENSVLPVVQYW
jgi:hypothetical protein